MAFHGKETPWTMGKANKPIRLVACYTGSLRVFTVKFRSRQKYVLHVLQPERAGLFLGKSRWEGEGESRRYLCHLVGWVLSRRSA